MIEYRLEAFLEEVWEDLTDDVLLGSVVVGWGNKGGGVLDRVGQSGTLSFRLDNSEHNSAGQVGLYSPRHPDKRPGWKTGVQIRFTLIDGTEEIVKHRGWLRRIAPVAGDEGRGGVACISKDWLDVAARHKVKGIETLVNVTADEALAALFAQIPVPPFATDLDVGSEEYPWTFDDLRGASYLEAISRVVFSEHGYGYLKADGTFRLETRTARVNSAVPLYTIGRPRELETDESDSNAGNLVRVTIAPREPSDTPVILARLKKAVAIPPSETVRIELKYVDPDQLASWIGGTDIVTPAPTTHYLMNTVPDGSGTNITADLDVVPEFGGDSAVLELTNNNAATGYVWKFEIEGTALLRYEPVTFEARNQDAVDEVGERDIAVPMPYQDQPNVARSVADAVLVAWSDPGQAAAVTFVAEDNDEYFEVLLSGEIGDPMAIMDPVTLPNEAFWVNGIELRFQDGATLVTLYVTKADAGAYWEVGIVGASEVGETTIVGPF